MSPNLWTSSEHVSFDAATAGCHMPPIRGRSGSKGQKSFQSRSMAEWLSDCLEGAIAADLPLPCS